MKILIFTINNNRYGLDISYIHEAIRRQKITPLAKAGVYVAGMTEVRGNIYTCVDLSGVLFDRQSNWSEQQIFLLTSNNDKLVAFIVDNAENVIEINEDDISKSALPLIATKNNTIQGIFRHNDDLISILDANVLIKTFV